MGKIKGFKKFNTNDFNTDQVYKSTQDVLSQLRDNIILNGRIVNEIRDGINTDLIQLSTTPKSIDHKLDRKIQGYIIVYQDASAIIYQPTVVNEDLTKNFTLTASASVKAKIWVF